MASRRKLKREIITLATNLYEEAYLLHQLSTPERREELDTLIDDLIVFTDDSLRRVQHPDGKDNNKLVKAYYRRLRNDIAKAEQGFNDRLTIALDPQH